MCCISTVPCRVQWAFFVLLVFLGTGCYCLPFITIYDLQYFFLWKHGIMSTAVICNQQTRAPWNALVSPISVTKEIKLEPWVVLLQRKNACVFDFWSYLQWGRYIRTDKGEAAVDTLLIESSLQRVPESHDSLIDLMTTHSLWVFTSTAFFMLTISIKWCDRHLGDMLKDFLQTFFFPL